MSDFLKRNKKKGSLALLLLFFQRGKGLGPLLALLLLLSFVFIAPSSVFTHAPWLEAMAKRIGLRSDLGGGDLTDLAGFADGVGPGRPTSRGLGLLGGIFGLGRGGVSQYGKSTVDMVKAGKDLASRASGGGEDKFYDGVGKGSGKSVDGVLRPEDSKRMEGGVSLSESEMENGLLAEAFAGQVQGGEGLGELRERMGAGASSAMLARASDGKADLMKGAFGSSRLLGGTLNPKGGGGNMSSMRGGGPRLARGKSSLAKGAGSQTVMYQLAEGKAYSVAAAPPPGHCDPGGCPAEFASNAGGAVFDGGRVKGDIITAEEFGDPGVSVPDQGQIDTLIDQANQAEQDAKKCEEAENTYGAQERQKLEEIQGLSDRLNAMSCASGGCSKSKYRACMAVGDQMRVKCREYNSVASQKAAACPLMEGKFSAMDCNQ
ncbi:MAG: hypothetical protein HY928_15110 [Elusimicrobia bacterium]|nr:hypothetical protein [Elusimicrobiota bacterium]